MNRFPRQRYGNKAPTKAQQSTDARMIVLQRCAAGLDFPEYLVASIARTHSMTVGDVTAMIEAELVRRGAQG